MSETQGDREAMWLGRLKDADARGDRNWKLAMDEQARRLAAEKERDEALTMAADLEGYRQHAEAAGLCEAQMEAEHARAEAAEKREARLREALDTLREAARDVDTYIDFGTPTLPGGDWVSATEPDGMNAAMIRLYSLIKKYTPCAEPPCMDDVRCRNHPYECGDGCLRTINHDGDCCPRRPEMASAASEAQPPPTSPVASSTQEGEKAPADSRDPPPETA